MNQSILDVCQEALYQLRQDVTVPALAQASTCKEIEWVKCLRAFNTARREILSCHDWTFATAMQTVSGCYETTGSESSLGRWAVAVPEYVDVGTSRTYDTIRVVSAFSDGVRVGFYGHVNGTSRQIYSSEKIDSVLVTFDNDNIDTWDVTVRNALVYLTARECAVPIAGRVEDMKNMDAIYKEKIGAAIVEDLNASIDTVGDPDIQRVINAIVPIYTAGQQMLPKSIEAVANMVAACKDTARVEVINSHDWSFSSRTEVARLIDRAGCEKWMMNYPYHHAVPSGALRVLAVRGVGGKLSEWVVEGRRIMAMEPIATVKYSVDVPVDVFSEHARKAYIERLCSLCAKKVSGNDQIQLKHEQAYEAALREARLRDSEQTRTPTDAWGGNYHVERMRMGFSVLPDLGFGFRR